MENSSSDKCLHGTGESAIVGTWVTDEVKKVIQQGYKVVEMYEAWLFDEISLFDPVTKNGGIFTEYVNTFLRIKQEASDWPEWCKTEENQQMYINNYYEKVDSWLTAEHIKKIPGLRQLAKLILNRYYAFFSYCH